MVVFIHSNNTVINTLNGDIVIMIGFSYFIQYFVTEGITRVAVPIFFIMSGYLFFYNIKGTFIEFKNKYKTRIRTLVIPYIFWSLCGILIYSILQTIPESKPFFVNELIKDYSFSKLFQTIFINPLTFQFWFVRDLIVLTLVSPIIFKLVKTLKSIILVLILIAWLLNFNFIFFYDESYLFFILGAYIGLLKRNLLHIQISEKSNIILVCIWLLIVFYHTYLLYINYKNDTLLILIQKSSILIGIISLWNLYESRMINNFITSEKYNRLFSFSFFVFAFHEPLLLIIKKFTFYFLGKSDFMSLNIFILAPLITISLGLTLGYYLKIYFPKLYNFIVGGR